jgi:hypothetical protein
MIADAWKFKRLTNKKEFISSEVANLLELHEVINTLTQRSQQLFSPEHFWQHDDCLGPWLANGVDLNEQRMNSAKEVYAIALAFARDASQVFYC